MRKRRNDQRMQIKVRSHGSLAFLPAIVASSLLAGGCATNLSTLQTADTVSAPGVRVGAGAGLYIPGGGVMREMDPRVCVSSLRDNGEDGINACLSDEYIELLEAIQAGEAPPLDPDDPEDAEKIRQMFRNAVGLALFPPAPMAEVSIRAGLAPNLDAGFRLTPLSARGDVKWRFVGGEEDSVFSLAVLGGAEYYVYDWLFVDVQEFLRDEYELFQHIVLNDPLRIDTEIAVIGSGEFLTILHPYGALKYRAGGFRIPLELHIEHPDYEPIVVTDTIDGFVHFFGGTVGMGLGWRFLRVFAEVTAMMAVSSATVLGDEIDLGGPTVYPALGLAIEVP